MLESNLCKIEHNVPVKYHEEQFIWKIEVIRVVTWIITKKEGCKSSYLTIKPKTQKTKEKKKGKTNDRDYIYYYKFEGLHVTIAQWVISN